ncbi:MAG: hypothetical protein IKI72_04000 [Bacteroidales bacterium]|nr:hypothetical protein [Bacteroidales bacterium]
MAEEGGRIYFQTGIDNSQMESDARQTERILSGISDAAAKEGRKMDEAMRQAAGDIEQAFKRAYGESAAEALPNLKESINQQVVTVKQLEQAYKDTAAAIDALPSGRKKDQLTAQLKEQRKEIDINKASLDGLRARYSEMQAGAMESFRTKIQKITNEMAAMRLAGQQNTEEYRALEKALGKLGTVYREIQQLRQLDTTGATQWTALIQGVQGVQGLVGAYSAASGVVGLFTKDTEKLMKVQTKMQSLMSTMMGMQQLANTLHSTSAFRIKTLASVTQFYKNIVLGLTTAMKGLAGVAGVALAAFTAVLGKIISNIRKVRQEAEDMRAAVADEAKDNVAALQSLAAQYSALGDSMAAKEQFIKDNAKAFEDLGVAIRDVTDAENAFINNKDTFTGSLIARAKAAAAQKLAEDKAAEILREQLKLEGMQKTHTRLAADESGITYEVENKDYIKQKTKIATMQGELNDLFRKVQQYQGDAATLLEEAGLTTFDATAEAARKKAEEEAEKARKDAAEKAEERARREAEYLAKVERQLADARLEARQAEVAAITDTYERELAEVDLAYEREVERIRRKREDWLKEAQTVNPAAQLTDEQEAALEEGALRATRARIEGRQAVYEDLLTQYQTYEEQRAAIVAKYEAEITLLEEKGEKKRADMARKRRDEELSELRRQQVTMTEVWQTLMGDLDTYSTGVLEDYLSQAEQILAASGDIGADALKAMMDSLNRVRDELRRRNPFKQMVKALKEYKAAARDGNIEGVEKSLREAWKSFNAGAKIYAEGISEIVSAFSEGNDNLQRLVGELNDFYSALKRGFQEGGAKGAVVATFSTIISKYVAGIREAKAETKELQQNLTDFANAWQLQQITASGDYSSLFGTDKIGQISDAWRRAQSALEAYNRALGETMQTNDLASLQSYLRELAAAGEATEQLRKQIVSDYNKGIGNGQAGRQYEMNALRHMHVGKRGMTYESTLAYLYPEIFSGDPVNGEFDPEAARVFLQTNTQITEEQRKQIQNAIDLADAYHQLIEEIEAYAQDILGDFAKNIGDVIADSILNGTDAMEQLGDVGADVIDRMARDMASSFILQNYLNQYADQLRDAFVSDQRAKDVADVMALIREGLPDAIMAATDMVRDIYSYAEAAGTDFSALRNGGGNIEATARGIAQASQDTVDELNGRATVIQSHTYTIAEQSRQLTALASEQLAALHGIERNTARLEQIQSDLRQVRSDLSNINTKGVRMQ